MAYMVGDKKVTYTIIMFFSFLLVSCTYSGKGEGLSDSQSLDFLSYDNFKQFKSKTIIVRSGSRTSKVIIIGDFYTSGKEGVLSFELNEEGEIIDQKNLLSDGITPDFEESGKLVKEFNKLDLVRLRVDSTLNVYASDFSNEKDNYFKIVNPETFQASKYCSEFDTLSSDWLFCEISK